MRRAGGGITTGSGAGLLLSEPAEAGVRVLIAGQVQGVGFRWAAQSVAADLGLHGWVRNLRDGRVEVQAAGDGAAIDRLLTWCRQGPPGARVEDVAAERLDSSAVAEDGFHIARTPA